MSENYIDGLFERNEHEDDVLNERYRRATTEKAKGKKNEEPTYEGLPDEDDFVDDKDIFEGNNYIDLDGLDNIEDIETLIDTGSSALYQKERTSEVTGKKVKNYVDNDTFCTNVMLWNKACSESEKAGKPKPPMPDVIGIQMLKIADGLSKRYNFRNYCVDGETEALTQRGWLTYDQITTDDMILSLDVETNELRWSKIFEVFRNENYDGKMFKLTSSTMDAFVTPEHKFVTQNGLKKVEDILIKDYIVTNGKPLKTESDLYTNEFVSLIGWFITEGSIEKYNHKRDDGISYYLSLSQSYKVNLSYCLEIENILNSIDKNGYTISDNSKGMRDFSISCKSILTQKILSVLDSDKQLKYDFILNINTEQRLLLIDTLLKADGSYKSKQYFQKSKKHIDLFLMLCALCGINTHTTQRCWETGLGHTECYTVTLSDKKSCYGERVNFHGGRRNRNLGRKCNVPTFDYQGVIWCPRTEYGTFMCRRGSRVYITGNTYIDEMREDAIFMAIRAVKNFDPEKSTNAYGYFNQVMWLAMTTRLKSEEKQHNIRMSLLQDPMYLGVETQNSRNNSNDFDKERLISMYDE